MTQQLGNWEAAIRWLREQPDQQELVRACFYDDPLIDAAYRYYNSNEWIEICSLLKKIPKGTVLEIGAGRGIASYAFARDGWQVTALEPDPSVIVGAGAIRRLASETGLNIRVVEGPAEFLPFADGCFDFVFCRQVLHHSTNIKNFCLEVSRVLRSGGTFMALREHVISKKEELHIFLEQHPLHHIYGGENAFLLKEYVCAIVSSGIQIKTILNPYESNINLHPDTKKDLKGRLAKRFFLTNRFIPDFVLFLLGTRIRTPGRLYSFIGNKV